MRVLVALLLLAVVEVLAAASKEKREAEPGLSHHQFGHTNDFGFDYGNPVYGHGRGRGYGYGFGKYGIDLSYHGPYLGYKLHPYGEHANVQVYEHTVYKREAEPGHLLGHGLGSLGHLHVPVHGLGLGYKRGPKTTFGYKVEVGHPGSGKSYQYRHGVVGPSYHTYY
ncbi:uncharacterized protein LOC135196774 [Macrobrachium nipponense]|uniref:uncharacterized protein LOC135196774 n=1 Tax=Macrobrachium nipponense TaxID=159736 RepID=UPI0030C82EBE